MKACEALELTRKNLRDGESVQSLLSHCYGRIKQAAEKGERAIYCVLQGLRTPSSHAQREAVWQQLRELGYEVVYNEPDQRDPCERESWTVKW